HPRGRWHGAARPAVPTATPGASQLPLAGPRLLAGAAASSRWRGGKRTLARRHRRLRPGLVPWVRGAGQAGELQRESVSSRAGTAPSLVCLHGRHSIPCARLTVSIMLPLSVLVVNEENSYKMSAQRCRRPNREAGDGCWPGFFEN